MSSHSTWLGVLHRKSERYDCSLQQAMLKGECKTFFPTCLVLACICALVSPGSRWCISSHPAPGGAFRLTRLAVVHLEALVLEEPLVDGERRLLVAAAERDVAALTDEPRDHAVEQRALQRGETVRYYQWDITFQVVGATVYCRLATFSTDTKTNCLFLRYELVLIDMFGIGSCHATVS